MGVLPVSISYLSLIWSTPHWCCLTRSLDLRNAVVTGSKFQTSLSSLFSVSLVLLPDTYSALTEIRTSRSLSSLHHAVKLDKSLRLLSLPQNKTLQSRIQGGGSQDPSRSGAPSPAHKGPSLLQRPRPQRLPDRHALRLPSPVRQRRVPRLLPR